MSHEFKWTTTSGRKLSFTYEDMRGNPGFRARHFSVLEGKSHSFIVIIQVSEKFFERASYLARWSKASGLWGNDRVWNNLGDRKLLLELEEGLNENSEFLVTPESLKMDVPRMKKYRDQMFDQLAESTILSLLSSS